MNYQEKHRKSFIRIGEIYFWTATINNWMKLLMDDRYKDIIINSFRYLSNAGKIDVFAFVIMPNHIHTIWRINAASNKLHEFWQRDPLPIHLYSREVAYQKLDYLHQNPTAKHWQLVDECINYK